MRNQPILNKQCRLAAHVQYVLDQWLRKTAHKSMVWIQVEANAYGEIVLHGIVDSSQMARQALEMAEDVPGVRCVRSDLLTVYEGVAVQL